MIGFGLLGSLPCLWLGSLLLLLTLVLGFVGVPLLIWTGAIAAAFWLLGMPIWVWALVGGPLVFFNIPILRQMFVSAPILKVMRALNFMPVISETEKVALEAGSTWVDAELFSGKPNFKKIMSESYPKLSQTEQDFLDGPCEEVCRMVNDWDVYQSGDLPKEVWDYLKKEKFFGLIVPEVYGGLKLSAIAQSAVIGKLSSRCIPLGISVMVPNSLGPAELLAHYGTDEQKNKYLPGLAAGEEMPCFALTEPNAGSDAGSISSNGVVFKGDDGELYIRLNWNKRYITLASISTLIGLAIKLTDPDNLLARGTDLGITCVLVPAKTDGVVLGKRHNPMGIPFINCPTTGTDVVVSIDQIIGGVDGAGNGWRMLMESLAAGRSISLPAQATALARSVAAITSAYSVVRRQFGIPIGKFEGVEEKLAEITGIAYLTEAGRVFTCGAVDHGIKPAVVSAIAKYNATELGRIAVTHGMDIVGGAGISRGPKNMLAHSYIANPIGITVEGANILTRTMIIFGQGAIRCHPYAYDELNAIGENDAKAFDRAFWGHIGFVFRNSSRALLLSLSRGRLAGSPVSGPSAKYFRKLAWVSASFAILSDVAMGVLGGKLKFKEKLTGRYADILTWMYYISATLRRFEAEGRRKDHEVILRWSMDYGFSKIQEAFEGIYRNFDIPILKYVLAGPIYFWCRLNRFSASPDDHDGYVIANKMMQPGSFRDSIMGENLYWASDESDPQHGLMKAFGLVYESDIILKKISSAVRSKKLPKDRPTRLVEKALEAGVISADEAETLKKAEAARDAAIQVDDFDDKEFRCALMDLGSANFEKEKR